MARMIRSWRSRSGDAVRQVDTDQLREQFIRQLTNEAESALKTMSLQFTQDMQRQSSEFLGGLFGGESGSGNSSTFGMFANAGRYFLNRQKTTGSTQESLRSREEESRFRLSQSQALAEAQASFAKGSKNQ